MKKTKDYVIELSLVIIGILIAFAIENWGRQREEREALDAYVRQIQIDLAEDVKGLTETVREDSIISQELVFLAIKSDEQIYSGFDTLSSVLSSYNSFRITNTGYSMFVNSPQSSLLPIELYAKITQYYVEGSNFYSEQFQLDLDFTKNRIGPLYLDNFGQLEKNLIERKFNRTAFSGYVRARLVLHSQVWRVRKSLLEKAIELQNFLKEKRSS